MTLVPLPTNVPNITPEQNFPPFSVNNYFKFSAQGQDLVVLPKVKTSSEIKPTFWLA